MEIDLDSILNYEQYPSMTSLQQLRTELLKIATSDERNEHAELYIR